MPGWPRQQVEEKGFSVAAFTRDFVHAQPVALLRQHGRPIAFATVMTTDTKQEATVGLMWLLAGRSITLCNGIFVCPADRMGSRPGLWQLQSRHSATVRAWRASAGAALASSRVA